MVKRNKHLLLLYPLGGNAAVRHFLLLVLFCAFLAPL